MNRFQVFILGLFAFLITSIAFANGNTINAITVNVIINAITVNVITPLNLSSTHYNTLGQAIAACAVGCGNHIIYNSISPYGTVATSAVYQKANTNAYYAYTNTSQGNLYIYNVSILKNPSPGAITVTSPTQTTYNVNATTPAHITVATCGGVLCVSNKAYYYLNFSFTSQLLSGNKAIYNYTVHDITNGTNLVPLTTTSNTTSLNVQESFKIPATQSVEITEGSGGDFNYSKQYIDPPRRLHILLLNQCDKQPGFTNLCQLSAHAFILPLQC
jgi:hypothetical protein